MEIATKQPLNPIMQDTVKATGAPRFFSYGDAPFNYGCLPQTWEDPQEVDTRTGCGGDNDPLDVAELTPRALGVGAVAPCAVFGALAMIDDGETDWKIVAACVPADALRGDWLLPRSAYDQLQRELLTPGMLDTLRDWFINYKTTDGKPQNVLAEGGRLFSLEETLTIIEGCHGHYRKLRAGTTPNTSGLWLPPALS
jgi:inorganic pyrophosphatase